ncbi:MAG: hypothetical protein R6V49_04330 [Bacteroidales bacterium]
MVFLSNLKSAYALAVAFTVLLTGTGCLTAWGNDGHKKGGEENGRRRNGVPYADAGQVAGKGECGVPEVNGLIAKAREQYYQYGNLAAADSLATLAVQQAGLTYRTEIILCAHNAYFSMYELGCDMRKALEFARKAEELVVQIDNPDLIWKTYDHLARVWAGEFNADKALIFAYKALATSETRGDNILKAYSLLRLGTIFQGNNQAIEGFRYFLNALTIAESSRDTKLLIECYKALSYFYDVNKGYEKAISYKMKEIDLIRKHSLVDSIALTWAGINLEEIYFSCNNQLHEDKVCEYVKFAVRNRHTYMKQYVLALFRSYLMNNDLFDRLRTLYEETYPEELMYLEQHNPAIFHRLMAIFAELDSDIQKAIAHYRLAEDLTAKNSNKVMLANFWIRYAEFLQRQGQTNEAIDYYLKAYGLSSEAGYFEFSLKAGNALVKLFRESGDFENALVFSETSRSIADSIAQMNRKDEMLALEIQNTAQIREITQQEELMAIQRRNNIQYSLALLMILGVFALLIVLGSFRVSATSIRVLGFISFIFLFEFIILLADKWIHHITHGEPLKVLGIKIVLIAFLLPLHHWAEKRVTHYLLNRKLLRIGRSKIVAFLRNLGSTAREIWGRQDD